MKIIYIAHCIGGDVARNLFDLKRIIRKINLSEQEIVPLAPYIGDVLALEDKNLVERRRGIKNNIAVLRAGFIEEVWLTGPKISAGMSEEVAIANELKIPVINLINQL